MGYYERAWQSPAGRKQAFCPHCEEDRYGMRAGRSSDGMSDGRLQKSGQSVHKGMQESGQGLYGRPQSPKQDMYGRAQDPRQGMHGGAQGPRQGMHGTTGRGRGPACCLGMHMRAEEIDREREMSGWNQYEGEEEEETGYQRRYGLQPEERPEEMNGMRWEEGRAEADRAMPWNTRGAEPNGMVRWSREDGMSGMQPENHMDGMNRMQPENRTDSMDRAVPEALLDEPEGGMMLRDRPEDMDQAAPEAGRMPGAAEYRPYYQMLDQGQVLEEERQYERDLRRLQAMYPETTQVLIPYIEDECDKMEAEGSPMFDARPDMETVRRIAQNVYGKVKDQYPPQEEMEPDEVQTMQYRGNRRRPGQDWLGDVIQTMLLQEMHRRRCRHNRCRRWHR